MSYKLLSTMAPAKVCGSTLVPPPLTTSLVSTLVTTVGMSPVWPLTQTDHQCGRPHSQQGPGR